MKNKTVAGILALVAGYMGLHRFYLGQVGLGIAYIFLLPVFWVSGLWFFLFIGLIDAIALFSMNQAAFDAKYNKHLAEAAQPQQRNRNRNTRYEDRTASRNPPARANTGGTSQSNAFLKNGKAKFNDYDYDGAIQDFSKALEVDPQNIAAHFNIACAYSLTEKKDLAFYHLDRAVALGFDDFDAIKTRDHLAFIRIQTEFAPFEANGFRLSKQLTSPKENLLNDTPKAPAQDVDLLDQLKSLAQLKDKGLLTEEEFRVQKEKLFR
jgi:TM2 domain-containing membrane protein YozV